MQMTWFIVINFQNLRVNKIKDIEERKEKHETILYYSQFQIF